jgi:hypothetical protein
MTVPVILAETMTSIVMAGAVLQPRRTVSRARAHRRALPRGHESPSLLGRSGGTPTDLRCEESIRSCESL